MANVLDELKSREDEIKKQLKALQAEQSKVALEMQAKASKDFVDALYKFCGNFTKGKVLKDFADCNAKLEVLAETSPGAGYLGYLEGADLFGDNPEKDRQIKFMTSYILSGVWKPGEDFFRVMSRVCETAGNPDSPFKGGD